MTTDNHIQPNRAAWIISAFIMLVSGFIWSSFFQALIAFVFMSLGIVSEWWVRILLHANFLAFIPVHAMMLKDWREREGATDSFSAKLMVYGAAWVIAPVLLGAEVWDRFPYRRAFRRDRSQTIDGTERPGQYGNVVSLDTRRGRTTDPSSPT